MTPEIAHTTTSKTSGWAISSLVLGIVAVLLALVPGAAFVLGLIAIFLGDAGHRQAARGEASGDGMAVAGRILGVVAIGVALIHAVI